MTAGSTPPCLDAREQPPGAVAIMKIAAVASSHSKSIPKIHFSGAWSLHDQIGLRTVTIYTFFHFRFETVLVLIVIIFTVSPGGKPND